VNRVGLPSTRIFENFDDEGNFSVKFESYVPTDIWVMYRNKFLVLAHPGDSLYLEFDGQLRVPELFQSINFEGDGKRLNQEACAFQKKYHLHKYASQEYRRITLQEYDAKNYMLYMDTVKDEWNKLFEKFIQEAEPQEETKIWASEFLYGDYLGRIGGYFGSHVHYNKLKWEDFILPDNFYSPIINRKPIVDSSLICGFYLSINLNYFNSAIYNHFKIRAKAKQLAIKCNDNTPAKRGTFLDSLLIAKVMHYSPDTLFR
jgi:hypothetical protein